MSRVTREEKVAQAMVDLLSDFRLDLDLLGLYLAKFAGKSFFARSEMIYLSSEKTLNREQRVTH
jgi:hypothetical protein